MRTLLLADDNITVQRVIALTFAGEAIQVVAVADGQQAIEKMAALRPDIVLAGTALPRVNGYDLARFMRSQAELQMVPVLLLAGAFETVDEARLASSGVTGIVEKPVEPTTLINRVKELLGLNSDEKAAPTGRLVTPGTAPADRTKSPVTAPRSVPPTRQVLPNGPGKPEPRPGDYLDSLDTAFDSLDQQLSGQPSPAKAPRNPAGPLGHGGGAADPRSPGRAPSAAGGATGNPVFEVDDDWFAESKKARDVRAPEQQHPAKEKIELVAPEVTDEMLDQIASRVADRLTAGAFGDA